MANPIDNYRGGNAPAPTERTVPRIIQLLETDNVKKGIAAVVGKNMSADRMTRLMINACHKTPLLLQCDPKTVLGAFMTSAALGLEPNTPQGLAYLIPYKRRVKQGNTWVDAYDCQFQIGYKGFVTLAGRAGISIAAGAIRQNDLFDYCVGSETFLKYRVSLTGERGDLIGAFAYSKVDGSELATVLPLSELHKIRAKSETYTSLVRRVAEASTQSDRVKAEQKLADTPWVMWDDDMSAKSAIKKHSKMLPLGMALSVASELDNQSEAGVLDLSAMADPDAARALVEDGYLPTAEAEQEEAPQIEHEKVEQLEGASQVKQADPVAAKSSAPRRTNPRQAEKPANTNTQADEPPPAGDLDFNAE